MVCRLPLELIFCILRRNLACAPSIVLFYFIYFACRMTKQKKKQETRTYRTQNKHRQVSWGKRGRGSVMPNAKHKSSYSCRPYILVQDILYRLWLWLWLMADRNAGEAWKWGHCIAADPIYMAIYHLFLTFSTFLPRILAAKISQNKVKVATIAFIKIKQ